MDKGLDRRREALTIFVGEIIYLLQKEGCSFGDLLDAIGSWAYTRSSSENLIKHLENAVIEARGTTESE